MGGCEPIDRAAIAATSFEQPDGRPKNWYIFASQKYCNQCGGAKSQRVLV